MARERIKNPQVDCTHCGSKMTRYRKSSTGLYYCREADCQAARRKAWFSDRASPEVRELRDSIAVERQGIADFIAALLRGAPVVCEVCGFTDGRLGYVHFDPEGKACAGNGSYNIVTAEAASAAWPLAERDYSGKS